MPVGDPTAACGCGRTGCWEASIGLHAMLDAVGMPELDTPLRHRRGGGRPRPDRRRACAQALARLGRDVGLGLAVLAQRARPGGRRPGRLLRAAGRPGARPGPPHPRRAAGLRRPAPRPSCGSAPSASRPPRSVPPSGPSATCRSTGRAASLTALERRETAPDSPRVSRPAGTRTSTSARAEGGDRVDEERLEGDLGRAEQHRVVAQAGQREGHRLQGRREGPLGEAARSPRRRPACRARGSSRRARPSAG